MAVVEHASLYNDFLCSLTIAVDGYLVVEKLVIII